MKQDFYKQPTEEEKQRILPLMKLAKYHSLRRSKFGNKPEFKLKNLLMKEFNGKCFWCDIKLDDYPYSGGFEPSNMATIDHLISRYYRKKGDDVLKVLCCYSCNSLKAHLENTGELSYPQFSLSKKRIRYILK